MVKRLPTTQESWVQFLGWEDLPEKEMATHSSILAWKIPWTEEPGRLQSMGSQSQTLLRDHFLFLFLFQSDALQLSESWWNHYIWEGYSANWWDTPKTAMPQPALVTRRGPILLHDNTWLHIAQPTPQKFCELGYEVLSHLPYSPDLLPIDYHFFKHLDSFLQGKCFHNQQEAENAFHMFVESWSTDAYAIRIKKCISHWQKCVDSNGSYVDE